jgi:hypothetical protein
MNQDELIEELRDHVRELIRDICEYTIGTRTTDSEEESSYLSSLDDSQSTVESDSAINSQTVQNVMAPAFDDCVSVSVFVKCGRDFWDPGDLRRSTFVTVNLHPRIPPLSTKVCHHSLTPVYDFKATVQLSNLSFARVVPVVAVREEGNGKIYGVAHISTQFTEKRGADLVVLDGWLPIIHPICRLECGEILMSLIFHGPGSESGSSEEPLTLIRVRDEIIELKSNAAQTIPPGLEEEWTQVEESEFPPPPTAEDPLPQFLGGEVEVNESPDGYRIDEVGEFSESDDEFHFESEKVIVKTFFDPQLLDCPVTLQSKYIKYEDYF